MPMIDIFALVFIIFSAFGVQWWIDTWYEERSWKIIAVAMTYCFWNLVVTVIAFKLNLIRYLL